MNINKVMLSGNLTRDPEIRFIPSGTKLGNITIAINRKYTSNNERKEETTFVRIVIWGKTVDVVEKYCKKGSSIFVEGRLKERNWVNPDDGKKHSIMEVVAEKVELL